MEWIIIYVWGVITTLLAIILTNKHTMNVTTCWLTILLWFIFVPAFLGSKYVFEEG